MTSSPLVRARVGAALAFCSGRAQGNVGDHVGDDPAVVAHHRAKLAQQAGLPEPNAWVWMRQVHGAHVHVADAPTDEPPEADAAITARRGLPLAVVTADCAPIVVATDNVIGVIHAGHRGLAAGVIERTVEQLRALDGRGDIHAFLGPCIHPADYAFGHDDLAPLTEQFGPEVATRTRDGHAAFDIPAAVRIALVRAGVERLDDAQPSTASDAYFSYRRDGATGRQATIAVLP